MTQLPGGDRHAARPVRCAAPPPAGAPARPRKRPARREDDMAAYVREVVDSRPPLTDEQRDLLALIFRSRHRKE